VAGGRWRKKRKKNGDARIARARARAGTVMPARDGIYKLQKRDTAAVLPPRVVSIAGSFVTRFVRCRDGDAWACTGCLFDALPRDIRISHAVRSMGEANERRNPRFSRARVFSASSPAAVYTGGIDQSTLYLAHLARLRLDTIRKVLPKV